MEQEQPDALSSRAAAFSIASLLTQNSKEVAETPEISCSARLPTSTEDYKLREHFYMNTSVARPCITAAEGDSCRKPTHEENHPNNGDSYSIKKILEHSHPKLESDTKNKPISMPGVMDPLQQFAACCDIVRNIDFLRGNFSYNRNPRFTGNHREVQVALQQSELWWKFYACGTEMVITRTGRRMFPTLALSFLGMDPRKYYSIHVDLVPMDGYNYTFVNNTWQVSGMASEMHHLSHIQSYQADETVHTGLYWMKNGVDFKKIRLTNRRTGSFKDGELHLSPNRKYQPRIHVVEETEEGTKVSCSTYVFPETAFIAVTTYQNEELIQLKIDHNPFAKGFRDKGARRRFIPYEQRIHSQYNQSTVV